MAAPVGTLAPKLSSSSGSLEKARSTPVPVIHEEPTKQPLVRARTLSVVSTDSSTSAAMSPNSTPFQSPVSESAGFWTPQSSVASTSGFPPGFTPGQAILGPLPRTMSVVSNGSSISLNRTASVNAATGRPYPPGLGWTPQVTPHDEGLQRKLSFGFSLEEPRLRRTTTDLDAVLEAQIQDHYFSRELLLFYAGAMGEPKSTPDDPAEVGFLWPKPGFFRMQPIEPEKPGKPEKTKESKAKKQPKAKAEPQIPPPPPPAEANKTKEGGAAQAAHTGKGYAGTHGWKGYGKGQGWTGWQQGWPKGWSKGWDGWGW